MELAEHTETLHTIAQVTITLIGFCGIVTVIGGNAISKWTPEERFNFYILIAAPLTAFFSSFVPILVGTFTENSEIVWRISNAVLGLFHLVNIAGFFMNHEKAEFIPGQRILGVIGIATILAHFLAALSILPWFVFIFMFGLLQQTYIGIHNFILLFKPRMDRTA